MCRIRHAAQTCAAMADIASAKTSVCRSTSASVVAGDMSAMLWNGVSRMPRLNAQRWISWSRWGSPPAAASPGARPVGAEEVLDPAAEPRHVPRQAVPVDRRLRVDGEDGELTRPANHPVHRYASEQRHSSLHGELAGARVLGVEARELPLEEVLNAHARGAQPRCSLRRELDHAWPDAQLFRESVDDRGIELRA